MFKEQMNKFKSLIQKNTEGIAKKNSTNKKKIENLAFFLVILIVTLIAINGILGGNKKDKENKEGDKQAYKVLADLQNQSAEEDEDELEKRLENILETINGVRKSKSINYIYKIK